MLIGVIAAIAAPALAPYGTDARFVNLMNAPPTRPRLIDDAGRWRAPFIYPWTLADRLAQRYEQDRSRPVPLVWFTRGHLVESSDPGRRRCCSSAPTATDVMCSAGCVFGARVSLGLSVLAAIGSMIVGGLLGALAGYAGGMTDDLLMRATDLVMVLPAMYVALALRAVLPLVLGPFAVFVFLGLIFAIVGAPFVSRGVRGIVRTERRLEYAVAATSLGAGHAAPPGPASAPGHARVRGGRDDDARAGVHHGRGDAVVRGPRVSRAGLELGHDAARSVEHPDAVGLSLAAQPGGARSSCSCWG